MTDVVQSPLGRESVDQFSTVARLYDILVPDWPGEIDFYQRLTREAMARGESILEVACGTGRVAVRLAQSGAHVVGLDLSPEMLTVAGRKSAGMANIRWVQADMSAFELGESFGLVIVPGHSFQFMLTPASQLACLACIRQHLHPGGALVLHLDHQDIRWLGDLCGDKGGVFEQAEKVIHPDAGHTIDIHRAWTYEPSTQTASATTVFEEIDAQGEIVERKEVGPVRMHCAFRFEIEHLLARAGFQIEAVFGDFYYGELKDQSSEMIWIARK